MTIYYKATRTDGTDFRTGTIDYAAALDSGNVLRHPDPDLTADASRYLSVATVPTDCTGFSWPCRLFEVEAVGDVAEDDRFPNKRRVAALRVVRELPAHEALGPQGAEIVALIDRVGRPTAGDAALGAAWCAARDAAWYAAWDAARDAAWNEARGAAWDAAGIAAGNAAIALIARDLIGQYGFTQEHYDTLTVLWRKVVGPIHPNDAEVKA